MEATDTVVRHISESLNQDKYKLEIEKNSRGYNVTVSLRGEDVDQVREQALYLLRSTEAALGDEH